ncbi:MAG: endolytic transglycosylase MltG [Acutalibacteraceae bacterium]|nr:endolytic transglycosylase MltG [Acutalibacteraceae bacterium]
MDENKEIELTDEQSVNEVVSEVAEQPLVQEEQPQKKNRKALYIIVATAAAVIGIMVGFATFILCDMNGVFLKTDKNITINKGTPASQVAEILENEGVIKGSLYFRIYSRIKGYDASFKYGVYDIPAKSSYEDIAQKLMTEGAVAESVKVTIPEGTSISDYTKDVNGQDVTVPGIATLLEKAGVCKKEDFFEALKNTVGDGKISASADSENTYHTFEGYLFPDTYEFYFYDSKECAALAVKKMMARMESAFTEDMLKRAKELDMSVNEVLTLASIVQMESGLDTGSMSKVAAVFYNRLSSGSTLGSSPTCYYGDAFETDDGRYNTYNVKGLPPGPLCSPGISAIKAVLYPEENFKEYFYFVTDSKGKFYFHKTYEEQNATINRLRQENNWIYEYFD